MGKKESLLIILCMFILCSAKAQVGINTITPDNSSVLDIVSSNKGILIPRISLQGKNDFTTIRLQPNESKPSTGLLIYNLSDAGTGDNTVSKGFYYFNNNTWVRLHDEGFSLQYDQIEEVQASSNATTYIAIPGLDTGILKFPYAGIYKVSGTGFYSPGAHTSGNNGNGNSNGDGVGIASLALEMEVNGTSTIVKERFVSALSLDLGNNNRFDSVGQQVSYSFSFEANPGEEYRFIVKGREWNAVNTEEEGFFGKDTAGFTRSNGQNDAYRGSLIISLTRQF